MAVKLPIPRGEKSHSAQLNFEPLDNKRLANLCGPLDANLRQVEAALDLTIARRAARLTLKGRRQDVEDRKSVV